MTRESHFGAVLADCRQAKRPKEMVKRFDGSSAYERNRSIPNAQQVLQSVA